jgi:hypothetical protein
MAAPDEVDDDDGDGRAPPGWTELMGEELMIQVRKNECRDERSVLSFLDPVQRAQKGNKLIRFPFSIHLTSSWFAGALRDGWRSSSAQCQ